MGSVHGSGSVTNLAVRLHPQCTLEWLEETLRPAIELIAATSGGASPAAVEGDVGQQECSGSYYRYVLVGLHITCTGYWIK